MVAKKVVNAGDRFGRLQILQEILPHKIRKFSVLCDCGTVTEVLLGNLSRGHTQSCGCYSREVSGERARLHGMERTRVYKTWQELRARCKNTDHGEYDYYGGRGITYDPRWEKFENFYEDMGDRPEGMSIDRIDVNGNYCKENCRWATVELQNRNRRKFCNNTSGFTGVALREHNGNWRAVAFWIDLLGVEKSKSFSEKKYGAGYIQIAANYRKQMIKDLNQQGAGYSDEHGG
jgi:hypothetical protein